jgi:uncharacterized protein
MMNVRVRLLPHAGFHFPITPFMKVALKDGGHFVFRMDNGDDILAELTQFCHKNQIEAGWFSGFGSASDVTLEFYNPHTRVHEEKTITAQLEVLSLSGNVSMMNGHLAVSAHGAVADQNYWMSGGRIRRLIAHPSAEIFFTRIAGTLRRTPDLKTRLNKLK